MQEVQAKETEMHEKKSLGNTEGGGSGEGIVRELGMDMYTLLCLKWITNKDLLYRTGHCPQGSVAASMGRGFGGEWIYGYVWLGCFALHLKLPQHC